jgi:LysR family transcriptional regulator, cys regulon transcriptional activator
MQIARAAQNIRRFSEERRQLGRGELSIGTTHTQARYVLPSIVRRFAARHPQVQLHLHQGTSEQIAEMMQLDRLDLAIATGSREAFRQLLLLPCYRWHWRAIVPRSHPLACDEPLSLGRLAAWPIISYAFSFDGPASLQQQFAQLGLRANVALRAHDADVVKTYVRLGLGVGLIASVAYCPREDADLAALEASHLFPWQDTWIGIPRGNYLRHHVHDFIQLFAPHLDRGTVEQAAELATPEQVDALFSAFALPLR